jgi:hypothetical protein
MPLNLSRPEAHVVVVAAARIVLKTVDMANRRLRESERPI